MAPPDNTTIAAATTGITSGKTVYLANNVTVEASSSTGVVLGNLALKTGSTVNAQGINVNPNASTGKSSLTVNSSGDINTKGYINSDSSITASASLNATSLNIYSDSTQATSVMTVSDSGAITAKSNLAVGTHYTVTSSDGSVSSGSQTVTGTIASTGSITIATDKINLGNDGNITASGKLDLAKNLTIATDKFIVDSSSGDVVVAGKLDLAKDLNIATNKFTVSHSSGDITSAGKLNIADNLAVATNKFTVSSFTGDVVAAGKLDLANDFKIATNKFTVDSSSGDVVAAGKLDLAKNLTIATDKFVVDSSSGSITAKGNVTIGTSAFTVNSSTGVVNSTATYDSYTPSASSDNTTTTSASGAEPVFDSATLSALTTQEYVDKQIWKQTKRINTILGTDASVIDNFNNLYKVISAIEGSSDTVVALGNLSDKYSTLVDKTTEVVTSVSDVVAQAFNTVLVNCTRSVWADECPPTPIPWGISDLCREDGWYFKNSSAGNKINWYMPTNGSSMKVKDIQNIYLNIFAASNVSLPFIAVFTKPKAGYTNYSSWAGSKILYLFSDATTSTTSNKQYCLYTGSKAPMNVYNKNTLQCSSIATSDSRNRYNGQEGSVNAFIDTNYVSLDDEILLISVQTASVALVGDVNMLLQSFNVQLKTGTTQFLFQNSAVVTQFIMNDFYRLNSDFYKFDINSPLPNQIKEAAYKTTAYNIPSQ